MTAVKYATKCAIYWDKPKILSSNQLGVKLASKTTHCIKFIKTLLGKLVHTEKITKLWRCKKWFFF